MKPWYVTIQMKAIEEYFHVVVLTFKDDTYVCDHSSKNC